MTTLRIQFEQALRNIEINGDKATRAIEAHKEVRAVLESDEQLREWGVATKLIGSYSRDTGIYPGKDVDVFVKLVELDVSASPQVIYDTVYRTLACEYGTRTQGQNRSVKVTFPDEHMSGTMNASFAVDAVPAVRDGERWAIPTKDRSFWAANTGPWVITDPEHFGELSSALNTSVASPTVAGRDAYKPIVKLICVRPDAPTLGSVDQEGCFSNSQHTTFGIRV